MLNRPARKNHTTIVVRKTNTLRSKREGIFGWGRSFTVLNAEYADKTYEFHPPSPLRSGVRRMVIQRGRGRGIRANNEYGGRVNACVTQ